MLKCTECEKEKTTDEFYPRKGSKRGFRSHCKECMQLNRLNNKVHKKELDKKLYELNRTEKLESSKIYYKNNKNKVKAYHKKILPNILEQRRERYKNDINYKLTCNLRCRLYGALKRNSKSAKTMELIGCDIEFLKQYIENKFTNGMDWDNVLNGKIHIDHIIPCSSFDLSKEEHQKICFHYTNLQPLWAIDNYKKGARF